MMLSTPRCRPSSEPEEIDGRLTLIGTKRLEAYEVVNSTDDEVFHLDLYEWGRYFEAAEVQAELACSDFNLGIKERVTLLSHAKANAQRLNADPRVEERKEEIDQALNGQVRDVSELFNNYADQAGYFDICLLIYHVADYRNSTTVETTWASLIEQTHDEATRRMQEAGPGISALLTPYESVSQKVLNIAHRVSLDSFVFPIKFLVAALSRYSIEYGQDGQIGANPVWPITIFFELKVSHITILNALEDIFNAQDVGFTGNNRIRVIELIVYVVDSWQKECKRRANSTARGDAVWQSMKELLDSCEEALPPASMSMGNLNPGGADVADIRREVRTVRREVEALSDRGPAGSMRFL
ncbi:conserved hypothetical protein [Verticillium alfalfae VaMs.102]|uniref:Nucleoporin Nup133/Nup155-like C-terminal domain-containing protein n=1 Tax=Verticillium alfalfae (strain VaMs.102 / ATCC MYA-4576 / FGSC 10136) TaxID=526221 RepID=C9S5B6_VERA1|nr:conserved hypothetical protein [Verticillium alfalfae VaMs.102]EEY15024.1 conserved hypothetical protein [Verticillium alfalfae VaMs.102]